jgi:hypothetical protein
MGLALTVVFPLAPVLLHHVVLGHGGGRMGLAGAAAGEGGNERRDAERTLRPRSLNLTKAWRSVQTYTWQLKGYLFQGL